MNTHNDITLRHAKQLAVMRGWLEGRLYYMAADALEVVKGLEQGTRKDGQTPKLHHQLSVTRLVTTLAPHLHYPEETIAAAFLHDILEDHGDVWDTTGLERRFGTLVAKAVDRLTKKGPGWSRDYDTYFAGMTACPIASVVKLADRAHNLQTMQGVFNLEKQKSYIEDVDRWFYPMIRQARRNHPRQYPAYENLKILLRCQTALLRCILDASREEQDS